MKLIPNFITTFFELHFLRHNWDKWETIQKGNINNRVTHELTGFYETQRRQCGTCGLVQMRTHRTEVIL